MKNPKLMYLNLFVLSASVVCFEILSTRILSVIFVSDYAFVILSIAILGLGCGGILSYYRLKEKDNSNIIRNISKLLLLLGFTFGFIIILIIKLSITKPLILFPLLFIPFLISGIIYAQVFKIYAEYSFKLYASDLCGAALGALAPLALIKLLSAPNCLLLLSLLIVALAVVNARYFSFRTKAGASFILIILFIALIVNGKHEFLGRVPIGYYPEKDFYHTYSGMNVYSKIIDSRWSVYGRADLVQHSHQDVVRHLFIDGAAGTEMYYFDGNINKPSKQLMGFLLTHSTSIPFLYLTEPEKDSMLIIGPGGGKEVLIGYFGGVKHIVGVEVNPDFVEIVKEYKNYNGGIYTDLPNVNILIQEGRHYVKQTKSQFDLIVLVLPSTEQMQNIEALASNENYLLTKEAVLDYLKILTPEGSLIFTLHDKWELLRLLITAMSAFEEIGINNKAALNHFAIIESKYAPTVLIKKSAFSIEEVNRWIERMNKIPDNFSSFTYLPHQFDDTSLRLPFIDEKISNSVINHLLLNIYHSNITAAKFSSSHSLNLTPCVDDSPFFYKIKRGLPKELLWLFISVGLFNMLFVLFLFKKLRREEVKDRMKAIILILGIFIFLGTGFMILEISIFQKLILYVGSSTVSLSIILSSLLVGMGFGSMFGNRIQTNNPYKRLTIASSIVLFYGIVLFIVAPYLLDSLLKFDLSLRMIIVFTIIFPLGFFLGIPFPTSIQLLKSKNMEKYIPWAYGINGVMTVLGSVLAVIISMLLGFTYAFFVGLVFYGVVFFVSRKLMF